MMMPVRGVFAATAGIDSGVLWQFGAAAAATLGVFGWFQVTNFDVFLGCHITSFAALGLLFVLCQ